MGIEFKDLKNAAKVLNIKTGGKKKEVIEAEVEQAVESMNASFMELPHSDSDGVRAEAVQSTEKPKERRGVHPITGKEV